MILKQFLKSCQALEAAHPRLPYIYAFVGNVCLAIMQVLVKTLGHWITTAQILYYRAFCLFLINTLVINMTGNAFYIKDSRIFRLLVFRCCLSAVCVYCYFYPLSCLSISITNAIWMTNPIWTHFIQSALTKTRVSITHLLTTCTSFGGLLLITKPEFLFPHSETHMDINVFCCCVALVGAVINASSMVILRMLKDSVTNDTALQYFYIAHILFNSVMSFEESAKDDVRRSMDWLFLLVLIGVVFFAYITQVLITRAIFLVPASEVMPFNFLLVIFSFLADLLIFQQHFDALGLLGMVIICVGIALIIKPKRK